MKETKIEGPVIGKSVNRVDGHAKVTGQAKYSAEYPFEKLAFAALIQSTVTAGKIKSIDTSAAEKQAGVIKIITYKNAGKIPPKPTKDFDDTLHLLQDNVIRYDRQNIGIVVADTYEAAVHAANSVKVDYETQRPQTDMEEALPQARNSMDRKESTVSRGNFETAAQSAAVKVNATYSTPPEIHSPMETHACTAKWSGNKLEIWESTQAIFNTRNKLAKAFGIPAANVRVITKYLGGGFGTKLSTWSGTVLAALAARQIGRPVRLALSRANTFGGTGFRPKTIQKLSLAADKKGKLIGIKHECYSESSRFHDFIEDGADISTKLYSCPNVLATVKLVPLDIGKPTWMRAPGECPGAFALESAMDELAHQLNMDPLELRLLNYADKDEQENLEWSSKSLRECYKQAAAAFGWNKRNHKPGSMTKDGKLIGWGMASACHPYYRMKASAQIRLTPEGKAIIKCGTQDIGTGTYTIMTQVAADTLGLPLAKVSFDLGDTQMPEAPLSGGSMTAATAGNTVYAACKEAIKKLLEAAARDKSSPLAGAIPEKVIAINEGLFLKDNQEKGESYKALLKRFSADGFELTASSEISPVVEKYSKQSFAAHFAEVSVDPELGTIRVTRFVSAVGAGKIINPKTAASQIKGGIIYGIGMALTEEIVRDRKTGRIINADLGEYHVPVHADIPDLQVIFLEEKDSIINPLGAKGVGEVAVIGIAPAVANAVFHATGKRIRELPITLDKIL